MPDEPTPTAAPAPSPAALPSARRPFPLAWALTAAWVLVYLHCMAQSDWVWDRGYGLMALGMPSGGVLIAHGMASPPLVSGGAWHRLILDGLIPSSLLDLLFNVLVGFGLAKTLQSFAGTARAVVALLLGGVGGSLVHVLVHPLSDLGGAGGVGIWMGGVGAALMTGLTGRSAVHRQLLGFAIRWALGLAIFVTLFSLLMSGSPLGGLRSLWPGLAGGTAGGALTVLLLGPRTHLRPGGMVATVAALLMLGGVAYGAIVQAPQAREPSAWAERGQELFTELSQMEKAAERCLLYGWKAKDRMAIARHLATIRDLPWLDDVPGREALRGWLAMFDPFVHQTLDDPDRALRIDMPKAWDAWLPHENTLRLLSGAPSRDAPMPVSGR